MRAASVGILAGALVDELRLLMPRVGTLSNQDKGSGLKPALERLQRVAAFCGFWGVGSYLGALVELTAQVEALIESDGDIDDRRTRVTVLVDAVNSLGVYLKDIASGNTVSVWALNQSFAKVIRRARPELLSYAPEDVSRLLFMGAPQSAEVDSLWEPEGGASHEALLIALEEALATPPLTAAALRSVARANPYRSIHGLFDASACCLDSLDPTYVADLQEELQDLLSRLRMGVPVTPVIPHAFTFSVILHHVAHLREPTSEQAEIRARYGLGHANGEVLALQDMAAKFRSAVERMLAMAERSAERNSGTGVHRDAVEIANSAHLLPSPAFQALAALLSDLTGQWGDRPTPEAWERAMALMVLMLEAANSWGHVGPQSALRELAEDLQRGGEIRTCEPIKRRISAAALKIVTEKLQSDIEAVAREFDIVFSGQSSREADGDTLVRAAASMASLLSKSGSTLYTLGLAHGAEFAIRIASELQELQGRVGTVEPLGESDLIHRVTVLRVFIGRLRPGSMLDLDEGDLPDPALGLVEPVATAMEERSPFSDEGAATDLVAAEWVEATAPGSEVSSMPTVGGLFGDSAPAGQAEDASELLPCDVSNHPITEDLESVEVGGVVAAFADCGDPASSEASGVSLGSEAGSASSDVAQVAETCVLALSEAVPVAISADDGAQMPVEQDAQLGLEPQFLDQVGASGADVHWLDEESGFEAHIPDGFALQSLNCDEVREEFLAAASGYTDQVDTSDMVLLDIVFEESRACLTGIAECMGMLNSDGSAVAEFRRLVHTLKGVARTCGLAATGAVLHSMEDKLDLAPNEAGALDHLGPAFAAGVEFVRSRIDAAEELVAAGRTSPVPQAPVGEGASKAAEQAEAAAQSVPSDEEVERGPVPQETQTRSTDPTMRVSTSLVSSVGAASGQLLSASRQAVEHMEAVQRGVRDLLDNLARLQPALTELEQHTVTGHGGMRSSQASGSLDHFDLDRYTSLVDVVQRIREGYSDVWGAARTVSEGVKRALHAGREGADSTADIQSATSELLLVPLSAQHPRLERVVQRACDDLGRLATLSIDSSARIPASAIDRVLPALEHLVRNAVAHGIEDPNVRTSAGKLPRGRITVGLPLDGQVVGGAVRVAVRDDGAGINTERVRAAAVKRGLISENAALADDAVRDLLFVPGFSTAQVSQVAGRGVGLDVVRSTLVSMGGNVSVRALPAGGTEFVLTIPTDIATMSVVKVTAAGVSCLVPLSLVQRIVPLSAGLDVVVDEEAAVARLAGRSYPLLDLRRRVPAEQVVSPGSALPTRGHLVLMKDTSVTTAVYVDDIGQQLRVVTKPLGPIIRDIPGMLAGTVTADGSVLMIVNPMQLPVVPIPETRPSVSDVDRKAVLVVDDSATVRLATSRFLRRNGFVAISVASGAQALEALADGVTPIAVLCDIEMPGMSGFDLLAEMKGSLSMRDIPVIIISSRSAAKFQGRALELGAHAYLTKPYDEVEVLRTLRACAVEGAGTASQ